MRIGYLKYLSITILALFGFSILSNQEAYSQQMQERLQDFFTPGIYGSNVANYYFAQPGDFTMLVSVWGNVGRSGRYEVPVGTNIGDLLSLAGGPGADVRGAPGSDVYSRRGGDTIVRLSRLTSREGREIVLEYRIDDLLRLKERDVPLQEGDIIMIDQIRKFNVWDVFQLISTSGTLLLLLDRIFEIF
jgi:protein involved in polysaccharide export with SLBB domain